MIKLTVEWQGETYNVAASTPDQIRYEKVARAQKWPMPGAADLWPVTYGAFLAWSVMKRQGLIGADVTWEQFSESAEVDTDNEEPADPTQTEPESVSG